MGDGGWVVRVACEQQVLDLRLNIVTNNARWCRLGLHEHLMYNIDLQNEFEYYEYEQHCFVCFALVDMKQEQLKFKRERNIVYST